MSPKPIILWFRNDLRLADNRALTAAVATKVPVLPVFIHDPKAAGDWTPGSASRWWLHHSLEALGAALEKRGSRLIFRHGASEDVLRELVDETGAGGLYFSRSYEPWARVQEERVKAAFDTTTVEVKRFAGALLREPEDVRTKAGEPFKVYTPFWRALLALGAPAAPLPAPKIVPGFAKPVASDRLADWRLLPTKPDWSGGLQDMWSPGEHSAHVRLAAFLKGCLGSYADQRNVPSVEGTSRLSPHLHFGEISPRQLWHAAAVLQRQGGRGGTALGAETFLREVGWREFAHHLLVHVPHTTDAPLRPEFARFPWREDPSALRAWQRGRTGYPVVDAAMRELWTTGWMHNRARMIVASFLVKDLLLPWQDGARWFWDTLVDADLASNTFGWQWTAGCGADAAPYFRVFNPVSQGTKFDGDGAYVRRWVPELARLPDEVLHRPWEAAPLELLSAKVDLGRTYPARIVDHGEARERALAALATIRQGGSTP